MATNAWDDTRYSGVTNANQIDDEARRSRVDISDRWIQGGHKVAFKTPPATSSVENDDGKHCVGWETQSFQSAAGYWSVYDFNATTPALRVFGSMHATQPGEINAMAGWKFTGLNVTTGTDPGHLHTQGGVIGGKSGTLSTGYVKPGYFRWAKGASEGTQTILGLYGRVATAPTGASLIIEVRKVAATILDSVDAYTDAATTLIGTITITAGNFAAATTGLAATLVDGDAIVLKITQVGSTVSGAELSVSAVITG